MIERRVVLYVLLLILTFCLLLDSPSILARDKDKPINSPVDKGQVHSGLNRSTRQVTPNPILIDPRNPAALESMGIGVGIAVLEPEEPWVIYTMSATQCDWSVRKPGDYAVKSLEGTIMGNVDLVIGFGGFEDLRSSNLLAQPLPSYYGATLLNLTVGQVVWWRALDFNGQSLTIPPSPTVPVNWSLWNKVSVQNEASADEYEDDAVVIFEMLNMKTWLDGQTEGGL